MIPDRFPVYQNPSLTVWVRLPPQHAETLRQIAKDRQELPDATATRLLVNLLRRWA